MKNPWVLLFFGALLLCPLFLTGCGGSRQSSAMNSDPVPALAPTPTPVPTPVPTPTPPSGISTTVPQIGHVALMIFENQEEDKTLGNPNMAFLTQLAQQNAYAANYFADVHPSLGNYFMLSTGQIISNDLNFAGIVDADNIVREVIKAGKTWKAYEESLPSPGFLGDKPYPYVKGHNPASYFSDTHNDPNQAANIVGFDQLNADLASGNLPNFMFIEPNQIDTMHDCPGGGINCNNDARLRGGDAWAAQHIPAIINNLAFQQDGLLIITWDESWDVDLAHGGGHVLTIMIGPKVKQQFASSTFYQHESVLRTICDALRIPTMGNAADAPAMAEFFIGN